MKKLLKASVNSRTVLPALLGVALYVVSSSVFLLAGAVEVFDTSHSEDANTSTSRVTINMESTVTFTTGTPCECDLSVDHSFEVSGAGISSSASGYSANYPNFEGLSVHGQSSDTTSYTPNQGLQQGSVRWTGNLQPTFDHFEEAAEGHVSEIIYVSIN